MWLCLNRPKKKFHPLENQWDQDYCNLYLLIYFGALTIFKVTNQNYNNISWMQSKKKRFRLCILEKSW